MHTELKKLMEEQRYMENDLSNIQLRWHALREEKMKTTSALEDVKRLEDDLEHLAKEKNQIELEEKVV